MLLKRIIPVILSIILMMATGVTAFADEKPLNASFSIVDESSAKISKDEAKNIAINALKNLMDLQIDENKAQGRAELVANYDINGGYIWEIGWNVNSGTMNIDASVTIDAENGTIIGIRKYEYSSDGKQPQVPKITEEQGKKEAESFLDRVNPNIRVNSKFVKYPTDMIYKYGGYQPVNYIFQYVRLINGIEFPDNSAFIEVNGATGKVMSFYSRWWDSINVPSAEGIIDTGKALDTFKASGSFEFQYIACRNPYYYEETPKSIKLVYTRLMPQGNIVDAKDGKFVVLPGNDLASAETVDMTNQQRYEFYNKVAEVKKLDKDLDKNGAEDRIEEILKDIGFEGYTIENLSYRQNQTMGGTFGKTVWQAQFIKTNGDSPMGEGGDVIIDASTGQLLSINRYYYPEVENGSNNEIRFSYEDLFQKAIDLIAKYYPNRIKDIKTEQRKFNNYYIDASGKMFVNPVYYFSFPRLVNGIPYPENNISISLDARSGMVNDLRCYWDDSLVFPDAKNAISKEEATKIFFDAYKPSLTYLTINKSTDYRKPDLEVKIAYILKGADGNSYPEYIDAVSGKIVDYSGNEKKSSTNSFAEKIKGHPLEKELSILAFQGIIDTETFDLTKQATKLDVIKAVVNVKGFNLYMIRDMEALKFTDISKDSDEYKYLQLAVKYGIIENKAEAFNGSQKMTREDLAVLIVKLTQYNKLAAAKGIFNLSFKDTKSISADKLGYVAIAKGLGIMDGTNNAFRPKDNVTMVEMADALYKALEYLKTTY